MSFCLVIPDLHPDVADSAMLHAHSMPALGRLLGGSVTHRVDRGWRAGLSRDAGWEQGSMLAPATVAAMAMQPANRGPDVGFAQPVHQVAGLSRVHLHPAGLLRLREAEADQLCETFNHELGADGLRLCRVGGGLLILGTFGIAKDSSEGQEPGRYLGRELVAAGDRMSPALRRLSTEAEMWLHQHPVNRARELRGELPVNALWFWGTGPVAIDDLSGGAEVASPGIAYGDEPFLLGLWKVLHGEIRPAVTDYGHVRESPSCVVHSDASQPGVTMLASLETAWFEPLLEAIESRRLAALRLRIGEHRWDIRRQGFSRWWRRPTPWWEQFAT